MTVQLNHHIIPASDREASARFMAEVFGLDEPVAAGPFLEVKTANGVSLDFIQADGDVPSLHYAFLVSEEEFDAVFARITERDLPYWADPHGNRPGEVNTNDGGRGFYFSEPSGHWLEAITVPYGGW